MNAAGQPVLTLAFVQKSLTGGARAGILEPIGRHTDDHECRTAEQLWIDRLNGIGLCVYHAERSATLEPILAHRDDFPSPTDERHVCVVALMLCRVAMLIRENEVLHVSLNPSGQRLCRWTRAVVVAHSARCVHGVGWGWPTPQSRFWLAGGHCKR